jgi:hypothetical protein
MNFKNIEELKQFMSGNNPLGLGGKLFSIEYVDEQFANRKNDDVMVFYGKVSNRNIEGGDEIEIVCSIESICFDKDGNTISRDELYSRINRNDA